ncbi:ANTAR domain-containing protein [Modestobacter marinus]|uniref:ANTAR domain-containing protein n=1 Tax=Modestobacter marinus TaxID=477641 RepID=UPI001C9424B3|nr:ANTAR domain-containing protein [Modestobacter marinus]
MTTASEPRGREPGLPLPAGPADAVLEQLIRLDTASEERSVAEEELRVQQEQLQDLLLRYDAQRRWRTQLSALLPVGLAVTDGHGQLLDANPALAGHLRVGLHRLYGKPLSVFLHPADITTFRDALRDLASGALTELRATITVRPRQDGDGGAELFGFAETAHADRSLARVQWLVMPQVPNGRSPTGGPADSPSFEHQPDSLGLAASLAGLSMLPTDESDQQRLLARMAVLVRGAVPAADWVSITLGSPSDPQRLATDSLEAQAFDGLQLQAQEGPCWTAYADGSVVLSPDVPDAVRWPMLAKLAADAPVRSVLALPVGMEGERRGVVNVYSSHRHAFGPSNRQIAELVAGAVAGVLQTVAERESLQRLSANLEHALTSRATIDQAKGVLMAHLGIGPDEAWARLVALSSRLNIKVRDLARLVVEGDAGTVLAALRR